MSSKWMYIDAYLLRLLLEFFDGSLVDTAALVDEVAGGGRLAGVHVSDDDNVDMYLLPRHDCDGKLTELRFAARIDKIRE